MSYEIKFVIFWQCMKFGQYRECSQDICPLLLCGYQEVHDLTSPSLIALTAPANFERK